MNISLDNPTILGITNNYSFSQGGIALRQVQNISIEGILLSLNSVTGVAGIWNQIQGSNTFDGLINITINGVSYTNAKINSFDYTQGENQDVKSKPLKIDFEVYSEFGSSNDKDYLDTYTLQNIETISDSFGLALAEGNKKDYNHSFSLQYFNTTGSSLVSSSRTIAAGVLATNKYALSMLGDGYSNSYKRYYNETFDVYKGSYSLNQTLSYLDNISSNASLSLGYSVQLGNGGVITVKEEGEIQGLVDDKYTNALTLFNSNYGGAFGRCQGYLNDFSSELTPALTTLLNQPISTTITKDEFLGKINYTKEFTNQPRLDPTNTVIIDNNIDFNKSEDGFVEFTENGTYTAYGPTSADNPSNNLKFKSALTKYSADYSTVYSSPTKSNVAALSQGLFTFGTSPTKYYILNASVGYNITDGKITFNHKYSNKKLYDIADPFKSITVEKSEEDAVPSIQIFQVPGFGDAGGKELAQYLKRATPIKQSINVTIKGKKDSKIATYISKFNDYIPALVMPNFLLSKNFSFNPVKNSFNGTAEWIFFDKRNRGRNDFTINKAQNF
jgi:hypothetical protein